MKKRVCFLIAACFLLTMLAGCGGDTENAYYDMEFHRGGRDARPENTLYAYQYAVENGASTIECDMQLTKDGELVMTHAPILDPNFVMDKDGDYVEENEYIINRMTLKELKTFNVGHIAEGTEYYDLHGRTQITADAKIPTLRELFELIRDSGDEDIRLSIEAKGYADPECGIYYENRNEPEDIIPVFYDLVKEFGFEDRVLLQSMDWEFLKEMEKVDPDIETVALYSEEPSWEGPDATTLWLDREEASPWLGGLDIHDFDGDPVKAAHSLGLDVVSPYFEELDEDIVEEAHSFGMKVVPWTVNEAKDIEHMYEIGVDGIISDRPWIMREVLEKKGAKLRETKGIDLPYHFDEDHIDVEPGAAEGGNDAAY